MKTELTQQQLAQLNRQLAGIELPPPADWWPLIWMGIAIVIAAICIAVFLFMRKQNQPRDSLRSAAPKRLEQIQQQWRNGELDQRATAYQLATLLRLALNLKQLDHHTPPSLHNHESQWHSLITLLEQLRYQPHNNAQLDEQTFSTIHQWLRQDTAEC